MLKGWLKEPLAHFMALGTLIFVAYAVLSPGTSDPDEIVLTRGQQEHLLTAFTRTWQRPPTAAEFEGLVRDWIREEIAYREGVAMGLDVNDTIIRRRLRQKLELVTEDLVGLAEPTEEQLQDYLERNANAYLREPRYSLRQVYFSPDRRGDDVTRDAEQALVLLDSDDPLVNPAELGDPLPLPFQLDQEWRSAVARQFGADFVTGLDGVEPGTWAGPIRSGYGLHLVVIDAFEGGGPLSLDEARRAVTRDFENQRRLEAIDQLYEALADRYTVRVEPLEGEASGP